MISLPWAWESWVMVAKLLCLLGGIYVLICVLIYGTMVFVERIRRYRQQNRSWIDGNGHF